MIRRIRMENRQYPHNKFYEVLIVNGSRSASVVARYGSIGHKGTVQVKYEGDSTKTALKAVHSIIRLRKQHGYLFAGRSEN